MAMRAFPRFPEKYTFIDGPEALCREKQQHTSNTETTTGRTCRAEEVQSEASSSTEMQAHVHTRTHTHICTYTHAHTHINAPSNSVRLICFGYSIIFLVEYLKNQVKLLH